MAIFDPETAHQFAERIQRLAAAREQDAPFDWAGIVTTLGMVTGNLPGEPKDYSPFGDATARLRFDNFFGISKAGGMPLSFKGMTSEFDVMLNVSPDELAEGEIVFNGSVYTDLDQTEMTKNVDVSYIDSSGVLHLIENGKDMHTLKNKTQGTHDQKAIYMHLTEKARSIEQTAVDPLTESQARRDTITGVQFWYAVPQEKFDRRNLDEETKDALRGVVRAKAGLRAGREKLLPEDISRLLDN